MSEYPKIVHLKKDEITDLRLCLSRQMASIERSVENGGGIEVIIELTADHARFEILHKYLGGCFNNSEAGPNAKS